MRIDAFDSWAVVCKLEVPIWNLKIDFTNSDGDHLEVTNCDFKFDVS